MPRPTWTGAVSFGLVNVPVKLYTATESHDVQFRQLRRQNHERVRNRRVGEETGDEVRYEDIVRGADVGGQGLVVVTPEDLDAIQPERSRAIEIEDFVDLEDIDPVFYQRTYHVAPADDRAARAYRLLHRAMHDAGRVGIARFVMRGKQYLAAVRPTGEHLVLETMHFADEVRDPAAIPEMEVLEGDADLGERELDAARRLVDSLTSDWDPQRYRDTYRDDVLDLVRRKAEGEDVVPAASEWEPAPVVDLVAALEASLERAGSGESARGRRTPPRSDADEDGGGHYGRMTRDELYDEAQRRGVPGRSRMTKDELVAALREASEDDASRHEARREAS